MCGSDNDIRGAVVMGCKDLTDSRCRNPGEVLQDLSNAVTVVAVDLPQNRPVYWPPFANTRLATAYRRRGGRGFRVRRSRLPCRQPFSPP